MPTAAGIHYILHDGGSTLKAPLVLIHGAGGNYLSWPAETRRIPHSTVYGLDLPGHGRGGGTGRQTIADYARSVIEFMDAVSISRAVFAGHDMGGAIVLQLALAFPERVSGILLISTGVRLPMPAELLENACHSSTMPIAVQRYAEMAFGNRAAERLREDYSVQLSQIRQTLLYSDWLACDRFNFSGRISEIRTPTLVICGKQDRLTPLHYSEELSSGIYHAALQTVEEAGHMVLLEYPRHVSRLMEIFLKTIPFTPGG